MNRTVPLFGPMPANGAAWSSSKMRTLAFAMLPAPFLVLTLTGGDFAAYRVAQAMTLALLALAAASRLIWPSWQVLVLAAALTASTGHASLIHPAEIGLTLIIKSAMLIAFLGAIDQHRGEGFAALARPAAPMAALVVAAIAILQLLSPSAERATYVGLHPNLGGEILFGCVILVSFARPAWLRILVYGAAIGALIALQSRAALIGTCCVIASAQWLRMRPITVPHPIPLTLLGAATTLLVALLLAFFLAPYHVDAAIDGIASKALLLDHPERGLGTGLVGRVDTWPVAWNAFLEHPLFGFGMDQIRTPLGLAVHNGYLALLAEFGLFALLPFAVMGAALFHAVRHDPHRAVILLAGAFVLFFNARSLNLNLFPFLFWVACLPWRPPWPRCGPRCGP